MNISEPIGKVRFHFSSRFSQLIGRNLISNPVVAVSELVKNSYDADADHITVKFENLPSEDASLCISDDGEGMSFSDIETKWMTVGTDNKVKSPFTSKGRRKLGEKGIGRFSVERLARRVTIISTRRGEDYGISFSIDWDEYEQEDDEFTEKEHTISKVNAVLEESGTTIMLNGLRDSWDETSLLELKKELELLRPIDISAAAYKDYKLPGTEVAIRLIADDLIPDQELVNSRFISYAQAHLFGEIYEDGSAKVRVSIKPNISVSKIEVNEEYSYKKGDIDTSCGPITYEVFVFFKDMRLYRSLDIDRKNMDDYLASFSGVKIYRDGFRILPFGDTDNDWLELNAQRTSSPEHRIATQNAIGVVYITRDKNPGLQDVLSRENMYDTPEFAAMKSFVNIAFTKYTEIQLGARKKKDRKTQEEGKKVLDRTKKAVSAFSKEVSSLKELSSADKGSQFIIDELDKQVKKVFDTAESSLFELESAYRFYKKQADFRSREMQIYRNIATLGISAAMFGHEALNQTVESKAIINDIFADYPKLIDTLEGLKTQLLDLQTNLVLIDEKADFYRNYLRKEKQDQSSLIDISGILERLLSQHKGAFSVIGVTPEIILKESKGSFCTWAYEGDIESIITNLITNAYKALKKAPEEGYLRFTISIEDGAIVIHAENNGQPIEKKYRDKVFDPLFSTYSDGTGLGLTIVQDTLQSYQGTIELLDEYPCTHFKIIIPINRETLGE